MQRSSWSHIWFPTKKWLISQIFWQLTRQCDNNHSLNCYNNAMLQKEWKHRHDSMELFELNLFKCSMFKGQVAMAFPKKSLLTLTEPLEVVFRIKCALFEKYGGHNLSFCVFLPPRVHLLSPLFDISFFLNIFSTFPNFSSTFPQLFLNFSPSKCTFCPFCLIFDVSESDFNGSLPSCIESQARTFTCLQIR